MAEVHRAGSYGLASFLKWLIPVQDCIGTKKLQYSFVVHNDLCIVINKFLIVLLFLISQDLNSAIALYADSLNKCRSWFWCKLSLSLSLSLFPFAGSWCILFLLPFLLNHLYLGRRNLHMSHACMSVIVLFPYFCASLRWTCWLETASSVLKLLLMEVCTLLLVANQVQCRCRTSK